MSRRPAVLVAILVPLSLTLLAPATATAARAQADLKVTKVSRTPAKARQGAVIKIASDTVRNVGTARAEASSVRYYLTRNVRRSQADRRTSRMRPRGSWLDVRLAGSRSVPALNAKASSSTRKRAATKLRIPVDAAPGSYTLLACADDRDAVTERSETNNCTAAPGKIRIIEVAPDMEVRALLDYSNYNAELTDDSIQQVLLAMRPYCKAGKLPRSMSQTAATASIRRQIQKQVGAAKMKQLDKQLTKQVGKKAAQQAAIAQRIAAAAATEGAPAAALIAMLRAHELAPKEASHLVGAAGIATSIGLHREALALLDAADRLDDLRPSGFGISNDVAALNNRAAALLELGRSADALPLFEAVLERQPLVQESAIGAFKAAGCAGKNARAVKRFRQSKKRDSEDKDTDKDKDKNEPPKPLADPAKGAQAELPTLVLPASPELAAQYHDKYLQLGKDGQAESMARVRRRQQLEAKLYQEPRDVSAITKALEHAIFRSMTNELLEREEMKKVHALATNGIGDAHRYRNARMCHDIYEAAYCNGSATPTPTYAKCSSPVGPWNDEHNALMRKSYEQKQEAYRRDTEIVNAHVALVADPDVREYLLTFLDPTAHMTSLWQAGEFWTEPIKWYVKGCALPEAQAQIPYSNGSRQAPDNCDKEAQKLSFVVDLKVMTFKANCASVSLGADASVAFGGLLGAFAEFSFDHAKGELTIVAGAKGGASFKGNGVDFKSGVYTTVNSTGVTDIGARVGPSATASAKIAEYGHSDNMDFTFLAKP